VYLALAGLSVFVVIAGYELLFVTARRNERWRHRAAGGVVGVLVVALGWLTVRRNEDYRSDLAIWADAVAKRPRNLRARTNLGSALLAAGRTQEAFPHLELATRLKPDSAEPHNNLGAYFIVKGEWARAAEEIEQALRLRGDYPEALCNLGLALTQLHRYEEAEPYLLQAVLLKPDFAKAHYCLGNLYLRMNQTEDADLQYALTIQADPRFVEALYDYALALEEMERPAEAIEHLRAAVRLRPGFSNSYLRLAKLLGREGRYAEATDSLNRGLTATSTNPVIANEYARLLVTCPVADLRNAPKAIQIGEELVKESGSQVAEHLDTLAAAYAEAGRFEDAVRTAQEAIERAKADHQAELAAMIRSRLTLYEKHQPYRIASP
jgi:tetratricopeptide (TPR) repeat protein